MNRYRVKTKALAGLSINDNVKCRNGLCECIGSGYTFEEGVIDRNPEWFEEVGDEFEVGDWIWILTGKNKWLLRVTEISSGKYHGYGFRNEEWYGNTGNGLFKDDDRYSYKKATEEEVKEALIQEAERRGYKEGVKIIDADKHGTYKDQIGIISDDDLKYSLREDDLHTGTSERTTNGHYVISIYYDGTWAEIIDQAPEITINNHEVEFKENKVEIGCTEIKDEVFDALHQLNRAYDLKYHRKGDDITKQIIQIAKHFEDQPCPDK